MKTFSHKDLYLNFCSDFTSTRIWGRQVTANKSSALVPWLASSCCLAERIYYVRLLSRFSHFRLFVTPWTAACQTPLSMEFSRREYWSGLPFSSAEDLPDPGTEPTSLVSPELAGGFFTTSAAWEAPPTRDQFHHLSCKNQNRLPT